MPFKIHSMKENKTNIVSEPAIVYEKSISTFTSFEEMNEAEAKVMASISAINHLQNATTLIKKIYAEELKNPMNKKIIFK